MMERSVWGKTFHNTPHGTPGWRCGRCRIGVLTLERVHFRNTAESKESFGHPDFEQDWDRSRFVAVFVCPRCDETTVCSGLTEWEEDHDEESDQQLVMVFRPLYFDPPPPMIAVPTDLTRDLTALLTQAFTLYWGDPGASVTKLGVFVEALLTTRGVPTRQSVKKGASAKKLIRRTLHNRLEWLRDKGGEQRAAGHLLALKFLRNEGGHESDVKHEDVLDALTVLEEGLAILMPDGPSADEIREAITKSRGSRHRHPKPKRGPVRLGAPRAGKR